MLHSFSRELLLEVVDHLDPQDTALLRMTSTEVRQMLPNAAFDNKDQWVQFQRLSDQSSLLRPHPGRICNNCLELRPLWQYEDREHHVQQNPKPTCILCRRAGGEYDFGRRFKVYGVKWWYCAGCNRGQRKTEQPRKTKRSEKRWCGACWNAHRQLSDTQPDHPVGGW